MRRVVCIDEVLHDGLRCRVAASDRSLNVNQFPHFIASPLTLVD